MSTLERTHIDGAEIAPQSRHEIRVGRSRDWPLTGVCHGDVWTRLWAMLALPFSRWHANDFLEDTREMTLLGKPRRERDVGLWSFPFSQQLLRLQDPQVLLPPV